MKRFIATLLVVLCAGSVWSTDLQPVVVERVIGGDTAAHAFRTNTDTSEAIYLLDWKGIWWAYNVDRPSFDTNASAQKHDTLKVLIQHSPDGLNNWTAYDSTAKIQLLSDGFNLQAEGYARDSIPTMPWIRFVFRVTDSIIFASGSSGTDTLKYTFIPWIFERLND